MLVRLLLLRRLSPPLFRFKMAGILLFGVLFLLFAMECGLLLLRGISRMPASSPVHSDAPVHSSGPR